MAEVIPLPKLNEYILRQTCQQTTDPPSTGPCHKCSFILGTKTKPFRGGEAFVFALQDHHGQQVGFRVPRYNDSSTSCLLNREAEYLRAIERLRIPLFQKILACEPQGNNVMPTPFICVEWAVGTPLIWNDSFPPDFSSRDRIISSLANAALDLLKLNKDGTMHSPFHA